MKLVAAFLGTLLVIGATQPALAALPTPASGSIWNQNQPVEYDWKDSAIPPAWARAAASAAADDARSTSRAKTAIFSQHDGANSWISYADDIATNYSIAYTVANPPTWFSIRIRPQGTPLDWGTIRWCQFYSDPPYGCYDMEMVVLHEFGHALSLDHIDGTPIDSYTDSVMHSEGLHSRAKLGWDQHAYGRCDVARLQIRYDMLLPTTPVSTCLDMPTTLTLAVGSTSASSGTYITFSARLKIADDAPYSNLASDPLASRSVMLQRRLPGTTSWSNVAELAPVASDTGRYARLVSLSATYEWRANFNAPSNEGLDGDSSTVVKITVSGGGGGGDCTTDPANPDSVEC